MYNNRHVMNMELCSISNMFYPPKRTAARAKSTSSPDKRGNHNENIEAVPFVVQLRPQKGVSQTIETSAINVNHEASQSPNHWAHVALDGFVAAIQ